MSQLRAYAGMDAADRSARRRSRLLEAGLELLGRDVSDAELTVRGICAEAGLATRYFYESFSDKDHFIGAVFDWVRGELASAAQAAVASSAPEEQIRAAMTSIVGSIEADPRLGRLMFSAAVAGRAAVHKRRESEAFFAMLSGRHLEELLGRTPGERAKAFSHFVVGGVTQTVSAWLNGEVRLTGAEVVDQLTAIIDVFGRAQLAAG